MRHIRLLLWPTLLVTAILAACDKKPDSLTDAAQSDTGQEPRAAWIDAQRIINADSEPGNWLAHGRTFTEQRYSPLDLINVDTVSNLELAWYVDLDTNRGQEASPIIVDGVMYSTSAWSKVQAVDAKTGQLLWQYDPRVPGIWDVRACCGVQNRGAAVWQGRVISGTLDGRLIALDAETGKLIWEVLTTDQEQSYTITGAPRIIGDKVIIGIRPRVRRTAMALLYSAWQSGRRLRRRYPENGGRNVDRRMVDARRWRHRVGFDGLRP
jgi:glucose dehydrogenase